MLLYLKKIPGALLLISLSINTYAQNTDIIFEDDFEREALGANWTTQGVWSIRNGHVFNNRNNKQLLTTQSFPDQAYEIEVDAGNLFYLYSRSYLFYFGNSQSGSYFIRFNTPYYLSLYKSIPGQPDKLLQSYTIQGWEIDTYKIRHYENGLIEIYVGKGGKYTDTPQLQTIDTFLPELGRLGWIVFAGESLSAEFEADFIKVRRLNTLYLENFTLVNADTGQDIIDIENGAVINLDLFGITPETNLNIRANGNFNLENSIHFELKGTESFTKTENIPPYTLYGDKGEKDYLGIQFNPGNYTLSATPYSNQGLQGEKGSSITVNFGIYFTSSLIEELVLLNADTDEDIFPLQNGITIQAGQLTHKNLNIRAKLKSDISVDSIVFKMDGDFTHDQVEKQSPYALFGDVSEKDFKGKSLCTGTFTVTATPYLQGNAQSGVPLSVNFSGNFAKSVSLVLVNTDTQEDIRSIRDGESINLADFDHPISIKAIDNECIEKVTFVLNDITSSNFNAVLYHTEHIKPFAIAGDSPKGIISPWNPSPGKYILHVYSRTGRKTLIEKYYIVIQNNQTHFETASIQVYPNPLQQEQLSLHFEDNDAKNYQITLADFQGRILYQDELLIISDTQKIDLSNLNLDSGIYILQVANSENSFSEMIIKE